MRVTAGEARQTVIRATGVTEQIPRLKLRQPTSRKASQCLEKALALAGRSTSPAAGVLGLPHRQKSDAKRRQRRISCYCWRAPKFWKRIAGPQFQFLSVQFHVGALQGR